MTDPADLPPIDPHPHAGHETTDASPYYIGLFALALVVMIALVLPLLGAMFSWLEATAKQTDPPKNPLASNQTPPPPRLQDDPSADLIRMRQVENEKLSTYAWIDRSQRLVRIPVERAIEILAERGLPAPQGVPTTEKPGPEKVSPEKTAPDKQKRSEP